MECKNPRIEPAENGLILSWSEKKPPKAGQKAETYSSWDDWTDKSKVFKLNEGQKATDELIALAKQAGFSMEDGAEVSLPKKGGDDEAAEGE